ASLPVRPAAGQVWAWLREISAAPRRFNGRVRVLFPGWRRMKVVRIRAYRVTLPVKGGRYSWSGGKSVTEVDSTIVRVDADVGLSGWGEVCPLGSFYLPAFAAGARSAIAEIGPHLLGLDPTGF